MHVQTHEEVLTLDTNRAHVYIPAKSGSGKTTLAKAIIKKNNPHRLLVMTENKHDWEETTTDLEKLKKFFNVVKKLKETKKKDRDVQKLLFIVVFDDFNNQEGVNVWNNKTLQKCFTEGRKYNFHCILISHTTKGSGKQLRHNCHYTIAFKPQSMDEFSAMARENVLGDIGLMKEKFKELKSRWDFLQIAGGEMIPCENKNGEIKEIKAEATIDTSIKNMGNNNVINQSNNILQTVTLQNKSLMREQILAHKLKEHQIKLDYELEKAKSVNEAKRIIAKRNISVSERNNLINILNSISKSSVEISTKNLNVYVGVFTKKYMGRRLSVSVDHSIDVVGQVMKGSTPSEMIMSAFKDYGGSRIISSFW